METKRVKATVLAPPAMHQAQTRGFNILADIAALGLPYQATGGASTRTFIRERTDVVRRYIKSHVEALQKTDRGTSVSVLAKAFVCPTNSCSKELMTAQSPSINCRRNSTRP
jgi:ABC-type nitrate/sulfonate/bicarbonate transport system substrate-binding protein